ncbi:MAG: metallopeptidase family protein [Deltaproteobacteria bacterium]|nr:metallopeptidase family protein [Deltaproteobacteria bacterium]
MEDFLDRERWKRAESLLRALPENLDLADLEYRAGSCWLELAELDGASQRFGRARDRFRRAFILDPTFADAAYWRGVCAFELGGDAEAIEAWRSTRALDLNAKRPSWSLSLDEFESEVESALAELPDRARELLRDIPIFHEEYPDEELLLDGQDPRVLGLFVGEPFQDQGFLSLQSIHLYERNIERECESRAELREEIRITLIHETGHFFGLEEDELHAIGLG